MLVQLPGGSSDLPDVRDARSPFEAGLRRDLASAPVVSYDAMLGGAGKRAIDLAVTIITLPVWLPILAVGAAWLKLSQGGEVVKAEERIGYGGRQFRRLSLHIRPPAKIEGPPEGSGGPAAGDDPEATAAERGASPGAKWRSALERLPQMLNVITGDMALVGPRPLSRDQLEPLRSALRYYLSARPGVVGVRGVASQGQEAAAQYKTYALAWEVTTDVLILWDAFHALFDLPTPPAAAPSRGSAGTDQDTL